MSRPGGLWSKYLTAGFMSHTSSLLPTSWSSHVAHLNRHTPITPTEVVNSSNPFNVGAIQSVRFNNLACSMVDSAMVAPVAAPPPATVNSTSIDDPSVIQVRRLLMFTVVRLGGVGLGCYGAQTGAGHRIPSGPAWLWQDGGRCAGRGHLALHPRGRGHTL